MGVGRDVLRMLLMDENKTFRDSLAALLAERFPDLDVRTHSGAWEYRFLLAMVEKLQPGVVLADRHTLAGKAVSFARDVKARLPRTVVVILCGSAIPEYRNAAYRGGADLCLLKDEATFEGIALLVHHLQTRASKAPGGSSPE